MLVEKPIFIENPLNPDNPIVFLDIAIGPEIGKKNNIYVCVLSYFKIHYTLFYTNYKTLLELNNNDYSYIYINQWVV